MHSRSHSRPNCVKKYDLVFKVRHLLYYLCVKNASVHLFRHARLFSLAAYTNKNSVATRGFSQERDSPNCCAIICYTTIAREVFELHTLITVLQVHNLSHSDFNMFFLFYFCCPAIFVFQTSPLDSC